MNNENGKILNSVFSEQINGLDRDTIEQALRTKDSNVLINGLSEEDKKKLNSVLEDKQKLSEILKSSKARLLMKALLGGKNG